MNNENKPKEILVAVYGSLKEGYPNHRLLSGSQSSFVGSGVTSEKFGMVSFTAFPGLIEIDGDDDLFAKVDVEVYLVDDHTFSRLDGLEGYPSFYTRREVEVLLDNNQVVTAWIYILAKPAHTNKLVMPNINGILSW